MHRLFPKKALENMSDQVEKPILELKLADLPLLHDAAKAEAESESVTEDGDA